MEPILDFKHVGDPIPAGDHSIVMYMPTWDETLSFKRNEPETVQRIRTGYPRFFMPHVVRKLTKRLEETFALSSERAVLLRSLVGAEACRAFIASQAGAEAHIKAFQPLSPCSDSQIFMVIFPEAAMPTALTFWQHTGFGVSSRFAELYLLFLDSLRNPPAVLEDSLLAQKREQGRPIARGAAGPKAVIQDRVARLITHNMECDIHRGPKTSLLPVTADDVFLYPTGVTAIWTAHQLLLSTLGLQKSVCFGFPYTDTLKILEKWGPGCHFYPDGNEADLKSLEAMLASERARSPSEAPVLALFTESTSNPLLRSVDLPRLRALADEYGFAIVIDETIGNFANVDVLPYADMVVTSLTKIFSGRANTMGGSIVLNPLRRHYTALKGALERTWEDLFFEPDAEVLEFNSRTFCARAAQIDTNAEALCDFLRAHGSTVVAQLNYPKWQTRALYDAARSTYAGGARGGFGGLFSLVFRAPRAAHAFFDALACAKGPSLGTNFTLATPYVLFSHWHEQEWAASHGVPADLVRLSVGTEDTQELLDMVAVALRAAEMAYAEGSEGESAVAAALV
ncbi:PLP-dependent transferase [Phanerochaete sordida]|uniref:PLP-dependent transferase n=1 Tax=Phanerochaete sordida TaxID=48140 RepID=A0A9P3L7M9_9APHY|nr:PLP-dependent transferase [Phanerochaete sordida]